MDRLQPFQLSWRSGDRESDAEFRELIARLSRRGMGYAGLFAIALTAVHLAVHNFVLGHDFTWSYALSEGLRTEVALWDKSIIVALGIVAVVMSRRNLALHWSRLVSGILVLAVCLAILIDDILNGDASFSAAYFALALLVAVNTIPFKPWHTLLLGTATIGIMAAGILLAPVLLGTDGVGLMKTQMVYMALVVVVVTAVTSLIYRYRYEQYAAHRSAQSLNRMLEERTRALEAEKEKTEEQAAALARMEELKSRFFSNITHQFRTPLTLIVGPAQDALDEPLGALEPRLRPLIELIHRNALGLQHLIDQLLDLSRLDAGGVRLETKHADLQAFLASMHQAFMPLAQRKQIAFEYHTNCGELWTHFDADKLQKAIDNLLSNAFKFTPPAGRVRLALRAGEDIEIDVWDSGPGIPEDEVAHVFDRFHQARTVDGGTPGSGIGLALARELVELHGGTISVDSVVGFGARLKIRLPYDRGDPALDIVAPELEFAGDGSDPVEGDPILVVTESGDPPLILVIDDNDDVRLYLRQHLEPRYAVLEAPNGRTGVALARKHRPALVICDVMMPDIDGLEVCRILKADETTSNIPIVLLTARATEEAKLEGLAARADDYMFKPFSAAELLTRVENLIELRRMLRRAPGAAPLLSPSVPNVSSADARFLQAVKDVIEQHMGNSNFSVEWLADEVALSARQLQRRAQAAAGISASGLIRMMRLQRSAQLLERRAATVSEIAYMVGFQDPGYFARLFKQTYGLTPSAYAEQRSPLLGSTEAGADGSLIEPDARA
jgi:signal transduction histidine kinase/DNA-binding response OmpR family regulator